MPVREREEFRIEGLNEPISHYTDAVRFGDLLFVSGIAPVDENLNLVGGDDVGAQTRRLFENMDRILQAAGASFADILKVLRGCPPRQHPDGPAASVSGRAAPAPAFRRSPWTGTFPGPRRSARAGKRRTRRGGYLTDVDDRHAVDVVRREFFGDARPASTLIGVAELAVPGMKVEIDAVAGLRG